MPKMLRVLGVRVTPKYPLVYRGYIGITEKCHAKGCAVAGLGFSGLGCEVGPSVFSIKDS